MSVMYTAERYDDFLLYRTPHTGLEEQSPSVSSTASTLRLISLLKPLALISVDPQELSERNMQMLVWGSLGKSAQEQAQVQHIEEQTVRNSRTVLYQAIGATSAVHAVHIAFRDEIFYPGSSIPPLKLTPRDREVLTVMSQGLTAEDTAKQLRLSPETVRTHRDQRRRKNGRRSAARAITLVYLSADIPLPKR